VLLADQDRARWDEAQIRRGMAALATAQRLAGEPGPYALQAAIAAVHMRARTAEDTDWAEIVRLYDALLAATGSPVVELNRAVAVAMAHGPEAGLAAVDSIDGGAEDGRLANYHLLHSVRADLLTKVGDLEAARRATRLALA